MDAAQRHPQHRGQGRAARRWSLPHRHERRFRPLPHTGVYRVIDRPRRLVFTWHSNGTDQKETLVTVDFLPAGAKTEVVVTHEMLPESARPAHSRGWTSGLEHLDDACQQGLIG